MATQVGHVEAEFEKVRETKHKVVFEEQGHGEHVGTLYVSKRTVAELGDPPSVKLTIEASG